MVSKKVRKMEIHILRRLYDYSYVGKAYLPIEELTWGLPAHEKNMKIVKKTVKNLLKKGYLLPHKGSKAVSLNPRALKEIRKEIY